MTTDASSHADCSKSKLIAAYIAHKKELRFAAINILHDDDQVDDVLQDAYLKLVDGLCAREVKNPYAYCRQVVRNLALDHCRRRAIENRILVVPDDGELPEVEGGAPADTGVDERRLLERIEATVASLPSRERRIFELHRLEGKTQRETARILGISATLVNFAIRDIMTTLNAACADLLE